MLTGRRVLVAIGGGIAAYKACELVSSLYQTGAEVRVIMTAAAQEFIAPLAISTLSRHHAYTDADFWQPHPRPLHIELGEWAEAIAIAPLTANTLGKLAHGLADNLLTNTILAADCPLLLAPAANTQMWQQPRVQRNWQMLLQEPRVCAIGPGAGLLACDRVGPGRMAEPAAILLALRSLLHTDGRMDLAGKRVLVNAGGTREFLDAVRFLGNPSTGKMGLSLALAAAHRGAEVTLVLGPSELHVPQVPPLQLERVTTAAEMHAAMLKAFPVADWTFLSAAVADVQPATRATEKLPKDRLPSVLELVPVPDIAADLGRTKHAHQRLIGFAAQTGDPVPPALGKLKRKHLDGIVANPVDRPDAGFASDTNCAVLIARDGTQRTLPTADKFDLAHSILDWARDLPV
ncbi:phosphopantothenoylcysteine decarboxylase/phosphopantothenate--cysteine ligase [Rubidibacter lacunae KORDI 51-2]|uniref:Coenzyme A biosynthesis bifunctional protein CoaBC n=1 Tax=Rubidibacter lacunae KORDI 51-2 TaxID=582515 RepID=U5DHS5_9CHRO|nr:bifunctional phosphopantothenoylcysteine decarboxylase/phosphopantothenate--cysteine ligase CoaBC [Rubidibacter lacunae]ERN40159.1 phosphopantothenoylcysteine decarboxylase/phosphopantothenate--cysteine ligase [Rubidibacter lacunae KORDI 51-2]